MAKRPHSHKNADVAANEIERIIIARGWTSERITKDYGEDLLVRIFEDETATQYMFFVQVKSIKNIEKIWLKTRQRYEYALDEKHLRAWSEFWHPIVIALWDERTKLIRWEIFQEPKLGLHETKKGKKKIAFPKDNIFNELELDAILQLTKKRHDRYIMEQTGAQIILEQLNRELGQEVEYDPQNGIIFIPKSDGGAKVELFGDLASRVDNLTQDLGLTPDELMCAAVEALRRADAGKSLPPGMLEKIIAEAKNDS